MPALTERMGRGLWNTLQRVSVILPAGIFLGSAIALSLPRHNDLNAVTVILLLVSGAVSMLLYRNTFQQVRLGRVVPVAAFASVASRSPSLIKSLSFADVAISCIQFTAWCVVIIASAVAMRRPNAIPQARQTEDIANEEVDSMVPGARSQPGTPESSVGDPHEAKSGFDPLLFEHMEGQKLQPPESASGEASTLALSPDSRLDPAWIFEILGWVQTVRQANSGKEDETTIRLQV
ncbi:hypothetical protein MRS44_000572 [Fusarium solani]|uniref:Uncharacterized protein n=1 Tax=Fusarium solani TaxID=169388 RepID=A0A9P9L5W5_FUSSL|nr:uncharacterized protein B0J15DRAFT_542464 [Fusarium solani]KAH7274571.1 hypothetical protein B0J15DRAFT_542464 [Fusarium solani]KAJ3470473.1 hypothetical protein MRS44_000572 [Fusarium solani]KAJ4224108.1 hypothetical protein NW759_005774 [Fusarium solani]